MKIPLWPPLWAVGVVASAGPSASTSDRGPPCTFDTTSALLSVPAHVFLKPLFESTSDSAARREAMAFLAALAGHFQPPPRLSIGIRPVVPIRHLGGPPDSIDFQLEGPLLLPLGPDGRVAGGPPIANSGITSLNEAIIAAVHRLDSAGSRPIPAWRAQVNAGPLRVQIGIAADTVPGTMPLLQTRIPVYLADSVVSPVRFAKPSYPLNSQMRGETARIDVRYIVGATGTADRATIEVLYVSVGTKRDPLPIAEAFAAAAITAIADSRFNPALVRGCPVPATIVQRISFLIGR